MGYPELKIYRKGQFYKNFDQREKNQIVALINTLSGTLSDLKFSSNKSDEKDKQNKENEEPEEKLVSKSISLTSSDFKDTIFKRQDNYLIKIFSPDCPYCDEIHYDWVMLSNEVANEFNPEEKIKIAEINIDEVDLLPNGKEENNPYGVVLDAETVPTFAFVGRVHDGFLNGGKNDKVVQEIKYHTGRRDIQTWIAFIDMQLADQEHLLSAAFAKARAEL